MLGDILSFVLRIGLVVALWVFVWRFVEPRTQLIRSSTTLSLSVAKYLLAAAYLLYAARAFGLDSS